MGEADATAIHRELGHIAATLEDLARRIEHLETKTDRFSEATADIKHMRNNLAMMKAPVEDYKRLKERGTGAYVLITTLCGGAVVVFNIISYCVRVFVLGIDK